MGLVLVDRPASPVELVGSLVVQIAVAGAPEPVPVVVDVVLVILLDAGRTLPEVPVKICRGITGLLHSDAAARLAAVAVGDLQLAELALVNQVVESGHPGVTALLGAVLDDDLVLLPGRGGDRAFVDIVAGGLLDIAVLAGLGRPDRHQGVPVVRRRDADGIKALILESLTHIRAALAILPTFQPTLQHVLIGIDQPGELDALVTAETPNVAAAATIQAADAHAKTLVRSEDRSIYRDRGQADGCRRAKGSLEETSTIDSAHKTSPCRSNDLDCFSKPVAFRFSVS